MINGVCRQIHFLRKLKFLEARLLLRFVQQYIKKWIELGS